MRLGGFELALGFLHLNVDELVHIDQSQVEQFAAPSEQLDQLIVFAIGKQREPRLEAILQICLAFGDERICRPLFFGREVGRRVL